MRELFALIMLLGTAYFIRKRCSDFQSGVATKNTPLPQNSFEIVSVIIFCFVIAEIYLLSNPRSSPYDYTFRVADELLIGRLGLPYLPPRWLNEFIPSAGVAYSAFPLGAVLSMIAPLLLVKLGGAYWFPSQLIVAFLGALQTWFAYQLSRHYGLSVRDRLAVTLFFSLGTWHWCNLAFGGAWQIAIGLSVVGSIGAIYFAVTSSAYFLIGALVALAFGNRTELLLTVPFVLGLMHRRERLRAWSLAKFCVAPFLLGIATLWYNYARFGSVFDFGYSHIPGVLDEPWYRAGIFNFGAILGNLNAMLLEGWRTIETSPYLVPTGFGGSIFLVSPYLLTIFRKGAVDPTRVVLAWAAILSVTTVLWLHGNTGGWQFSYRYGAVLLPWALLLVLEKFPSRAGAVELALIPASIAINAYATYLFYWTNYVRP